MVGEAGGALLVGSIELQNVVTLVFLLVLCFDFEEFFDGFHYDRERTTRIRSGECLFVHALTPELCARWVA